MLAFLRARAIPGIEAVSNGRYARTHRDRRRARRARRRARGAATASRPPSAFPISGPAGDHRARAPRLRSRRRSRWRSARISAEDPRAGAAGRRAPGPAGARRLGRLRARRARHPRPADHGRRRRPGSPASWSRPIGETLADPAALDQGLTHVFPTPRQLAEVGSRRARHAAGAQAPALSSLAAAVAADPLIFGPRRSLEEAIAQLRSLAGIGEWTAQYIAMRELREPDAFPAADIGLMRAMARRDGRAALARGAARPRRALAALARLCGAASLGVRAHSDQWKGAP